MESKTKVENKLYQRARALDDTSPFGLTPLVPERTYNESAFGKWLERYLGAFTGTAKTTFGDF